MSNVNISEEQKIDMLLKCVELKESGRTEECFALFKQIPLEKATIKAFGLEELKNSGYNVSKAETE